MRLKRVFLLSIVLAAASTVLLPQDQKIKLMVKILQIPAVQSITVSAPSQPAKEDEIPAVRGIKTGGDVTQDFPDAVFMFDTEIDQSEEDLIKAIKEKTSTVFPVLVTILRVADIIFQVDLENFETTCIDERIHSLPPSHQHLSLDYELQIQAFPFSIKDKETAVKSKFSAKYKSSEGERELLFDQIVGVKSTRKLVVGFKANDDQERGSIYWLTFFMER